MVMAKEFGERLMACKRWPALRSWFAQWVDIVDIKPERFGADALYLSLLASNASGVVVDQFEEVSEAFGVDPGEVVSRNEYGELWEIGLNLHSPFKGIGDRYLPYKALSGVVSGGKYGSWSKGDNSYTPCEPPTQDHEHWFTVLSDASGLYLPVWYPKTAGPDEEIQVFVGEHAVDWVHQAPGLTRWEIEPKIDDWIVSLGALECWHEVLI
jgi:hypothetical protein